MKDLDVRSLTHHAYCLLGGQAEADALLAALRKAGAVKKSGDPDLFSRRYETLSIDDAREAKSFSETRPASPGGMKTFVMCMSGVTVEAQNALLKVLEEPPEYARFFLIMPSAHLLLPTVKSRLEMLEGRAPEGDAKISELATSFIKAPRPKRFDMVKSLMDDISKEKKPKQEAIDLLNALEEAVHAGGARNNARALEAIETARRYMNDRSPSLKMLLEYVALSV